MQIRRSKEDARLILDNLYHKQMTQQERNQSHPGHPLDEVNTKIGNVPDDEKTRQEQDQVSSPIRSIGDNKSSLLNVQELNLKSTLVQYSWSNFF